ncbi:tetratricopeptide repeat protein [Bradyrhizobium commune]|uniref:Tetratricopeptide repeat protein n=1 Tax=Bradyrhizobium commune TaxID=83627 RepID=A0A7S9H1L2_9BRAD|nr:tetratricopeptide repeat protein [Bradyrhizobium commune]QPF92890.1 tetratricopeptide repeat protein [Bradyrhizobium commune]
MAFPFPEPGFARSCRPWQRLLALVLVAIALSGCSFDLGSLMPEKDKPREEPKPAVSESAVSAGNVSEAQSHTTKAQALAKSGDTAAALEEFNRAVTLDPYNAQALYGRALVYQGNNEHDFAIADFGAASGLNPQKVEPLLGRAISYLAIGKVKEAAADLDEASEADPHNAQVWTTRGQAYEKLGDKTKAAASYARAVALRPRDEAARSGLARVGG